MLNLSFRFVVSFCRSSGKYIVSIMLRTHLCSGSPSGTRPSDDDRLGVAQLSFCSGVVQSRGITRDTVPRLSDMRSRQLVVPYLASLLLAVRSYCCLTK